MVVKVVFNLGVEKEFDYLSNQRKLLGKRVLAELNKKKMVGVVVKEEVKTNIKEIKSIEQVLDKNFSTLSKSQLAFAHLLKKNYPYSLGELVFLMVPSFLKKGKKLEMKENLENSCKDTSSEKFEVTYIKADIPHQRFEVYEEKIKKASKEGSVIFCVPSVVYLEEYSKILKKVFNKEFVIIHTQQRRRELLNQWLKIKKGKVFILCTKVGVFYFPSDLRLIIIEEENSPFYFHPEKPFYELQDIAFLLAKMKKIPLILSADFPSLKLFKMIKEKKVKLIEKKSKAKRGGIKVINIQSIISHKYSLKVNPLICEILRKSATSQERVSIFYPRKGFSLFLRCAECGYLYYCPKNCSPLRYSREKKKLICPFCGYQETAPDRCKKCSSAYLVPLGIGGERISGYLKQISSEIKDFFNSGKFILTNYSLLDSPFYWRNFSDKSLVLNSELLLSCLDFEAIFRVYLYLKRIALMTKKEVLIFTNLSEHYLWQMLKKNWRSFYNKELSLRKEVNLPPFVYLAKVTLRAKNKDILSKKAEKIYNILNKEKKLQVFGPLKEYPFRKTNKFYYTIVVKSSDREKLTKEMEKIILSFRKGTTKIAISIR